MHDVENRPETKPSSVLVRDAARLRAVMGGGDSTGSKADLPLPDDTAGDARASATWLDFSNVRDVSPVTIVPGAAARDSSATRLVADRGALVDKTPTLTVRKIFPSAIAPATIELADDAPIDTEPRVVADDVSMPPPPVAKETLPVDEPRTSIGGRVTSFVVEPPPPPPMPARTYAPARRPSGRVAIVAILIGTVIGVGLWAGVAGEIASLFSSNEAAAPIDNPSRVTETPTMQPPPPPRMLDPAPPAPQVIPGEAALMAAGEEGPDPREQAISAPSKSEPPIGRSDRVPRENRTTATRDRHEAAKSRVTTSGEEKSTAHEPQVMVAEHLDARSTPPRIAPVVTPNDAGAGTRRSPATNRYSVQVRATPDRREAEGIAEALRSRGVANVRVEAWKKNGVDMFRVRYGQFASGSDAKSEADKLGHSNVWIVRQ